MCATAEKEKNCRHLDKLWQFFIMRLFILSCKTNHFRQIAFCQKNLSSYSS